MFGVQRIARGEAPSHALSSSTVRMRRHFCVSLPEVRRRSLLERPLLARKRSIQRGVYHSAAVFAYSENEVEVWERSRLACNCAPSFRRVGKDPT